MLFGLAIDAQGDFDILAFEGVLEDIKVSENVLNLLSKYLALDLHLKYDLFYMYFAIGKSSSPGIVKDAEGAKISKNGSDYDITIAKSSHNKDKTEDNIRKSGLGYKGLCVLSQANAKNPKLYNAYELRDENVQLYVFDYEETLEDAEKSRLKTKEFQKDEKVQELKIKPIDYLKLNKLYETFVSQVELSLEQKYFSETFISSETPSNANDSSSSSIAESHISELEKESGENNCENAKCKLQTKTVELEKVLTQKTKDFDDVKLELSNRTTKFEAYFKKLENTKVLLEQQLARKINDSKAKKDQFLKEINHLRTQL
nr:hypothetical protein [Tanacetum cinerariifolium]